MEFEYKVKAMGWIYSNQMEMEYFSPVIPNIRAIVKTCPSLLHNLLYFSPTLSSLTFLPATQPPNLARFCSPHISG